jgi:SAM-dependent methyltransferase
MIEAPKLNARKRAIVETADRQSTSRAEWRKKAWFFHEQDTAYLRFLIPPGLRVLELGCGAGHTLAALAPSRGVGIDLVSRFIKEGRAEFPHLELHAGDIEDEVTLASVEGRFDVILLVDTMGYLEDCQSLLQKLHRFCVRETRLIIVYYSRLWDPLLRLAELIGWKKKDGLKNVLSTEDVRMLTELGEFDLIKSEKRLLSPLSLMGAGKFVNRFVGPFPLFRQLSLRHYSVCRSWRCVEDGITSATVVIPARNERGNIEQAILRMPRFCDDLEIIFAEGHSRDGTLDEMRRVQAQHPEWDIKVMVQPGKGKADAVLTAFDAARGDVLMILDADLTMPPEQLGKFWSAIHSGLGEFINGSRLIYPMDDTAMRFLNLIANRSFSILFSWLLNQRYVRRQRS